MIVMSELLEIKTAAKVRHEKARRAAKARGRMDFPDLPYECSWAFETEFLAGKHKPKQP